MSIILDRSKAPTTVVAVERYRPDIDGLRAIAVLPVMAYHAGLGVPGGFTGVDVFFVISGFLITRLIANDLATQRFSILAFYERRIRRIFPALFAMMAASAIAAWFLFMPPEYRLFGQSMALAALFSSNIGFWLEAGYFDVTASYKPLLHTWSLGVEEQFYIVFPLLLAGLWRLSSAGRIGVIALLTFISFVAGFLWTEREPAGAFFLLPARFWELGAGSLMALLPAMRAERDWLNTCLAAAGLAAIFAGVFLITESTPFPGVAALLPVAGAALVIAAGHGGNPVSRLLAWSPLVFVGLISYSLYLWHWPIIVFAQYKLGRPLDTGEALAALACSFAIAALSWRLIEQPIRRRALLGEKRALFSGGIGAVAIAVSVGMTISVLNGVPGRLPVAVQKLYAVKQDVDRFGTLECMTESRGAGVNTEAVRQGRLCAMGDPAAGAPQFLVWGDSHAAAMAPAIDAAATRHGRQGLFVGRGGCPPLADYESLSPQKSRRAACRERNEAVLDLVRRAKIPLVFMIGRWPREVLGAENGQEGPFYDPTRPYPTEDRSGQVAAALDATLAALARAGSKGVLVMDVPEPGYDVPIALARALLNDTPIDVNPSRAAVQARQELAMGVLRRAAEKWKIPLIDPTSSFCDADICKVEIDGVPQYRDADHITRTKALELSPLFDESFAVLSKR